MVRPQFNRQEHDTAKRNVNQSQIVIPIRLPELVHQGQREMFEPMVHPQLNNQENKAGGGIVDQIHQIVSPISMRLPEPEHQGQNEKKNKCYSSSQ